MIPDSQRTRSLEAWVGAVATRVFTLDKRIRTVLYTLAADGGEIVEDFVPCMVADPRWPDCLDKNPWADPDSPEVAALDELLMDACEDYDSPSQEEMQRLYGGLLPIGIEEPEFVPVAIVDRSGVRLFELDEDGEVRAPG